jgi:hypothetical protein
MIAGIVDVYTSKADYAACDNPSQQMLGPLDSAFLVAKPRKLKRPRAKTHRGLIVALLPLRLRYQNKLTACHIADRAHVRGPTLNSVTANRADIDTC